MSRQEKKKQVQDLLKSLSVPVNAVWNGKEWINPFSQESSATDPVALNEQTKNKDQEGLVTM